MEGRVGRGDPRRAAGDPWLAAEAGGTGTRGETVMNVTQLFAAEETSGTGTGVFGRVRSVLGAGRASSTYTECRRCGRAVDHGARDCPHCGTDTVVRYEFD